MQEGMIEEFLALTKIDAPSFQERDISLAIKKILDQMNIKYEEDDAADKINGNCGNIYAVWEGDSSLEPIMFSAHMDTVGPAYGKEPVIDGDRIVSAGNTVLGADDIAGLVEIFEGIRRVKASGQPHPTVEILITVAEEVYTKGSAVFDYSKVLAKQAYCLDMSGDVGRAARKAPSLISFKVTVNGKASHAGFAPQNGINAIQTAVEAIVRIEQGQIDEETTLNIGTIEGGVATNIVSERCVVAGEIRSFDHEKALHYLDHVRESFENSANIRGAECVFEYDIHFKAYEMEENHPTIGRFLRAAEAVGVEAKVVSTLGGADNHQFVANGIPGLVLSCGMQQVHSTNEYITLDNLLTGAKLVEQLILQ